MSRKVMSRLAPLWIVGVLCLAGCGDDEAPEAAPAPAQDVEGAGIGPPEAEGAGEVTETPTPLANIGVTVYFASAEGPGLVGEPREIFNTASPVERIKQILSDLFAGPSGNAALAVVPRGTRVRQVFVLEDGVAWLDISSELKLGLEGGSDAELLAVYSIVNSVAMNVPEVRRVGILLDGEPCETLNGHMDLRRPFPPRFDVLADWTGTQEPRVL